MIRSIHTLIIAFILVLALVLGHLYPPKASSQCQQVVGQPRIQYQCSEGPPGKDEFGQPGPPGKACLYSKNPITGEPECVESVKNEYVRYKLKQQQNVFYQQFVMGIVLLVLIGFVYLFRRLNAVQQSQWLIFSVLIFIAVYVTFSFWEPLMQLFWYFLQFVFKLPLQP